MITRGIRDAMTVIIILILLGFGFAAGFEMGAAARGKGAAEVAHEEGCPASM